VNKESNIVISISDIVAYLFILILPVFIDHLDHHRYKVGTLVIEDNQVLFNWVIDFVIEES
jgi:hypothetical protein